MFDYTSVIAILPERLGDSLFHTPSLRTIKLLRPQIKLGVVALSPLCAEVLRNNPYIDAVYVLPNERETARLATNYDVTLLLHTHAAARKYADWLGLETIAINSPASPRHWSRHSLEFTCSLLGADPQSVDAGYDLSPDPTNFTAIDRLLAESGASADDILIGCHIGCHSIAKRGLKFWRSLTHPKVWPFENFVALEKKLRAINPRIRFVLTGSQGEKQLGNKFIKRAPHSINLIDKTSVLDLAALMDSLALFITSDTGAMHVACAREVGVIALWGPTDLNVTGPYPMRDNYRILQKQSLTDLSVDEVTAVLIDHPSLHAQKQMESA
ncbi:MAG: glycosyltransferase family 9 protein [Spongiibacteraceae bacterium]